MRLRPPGLLAVAVLSTVAACKLNETGLGPGTGEIDVVVPDASATGASGAGASSTSAGQAGSAPVAGSKGTAGGGAAGAGGAAGVGAAGTSGVAGVGGVAGAGGAAGDSGAAGDTGAGQAGTQGMPDAGGAAGSAPDAHPPLSLIGCADGTREGFTSVEKFPNVAACSGAWTVPGMVDPETFTPKCARHGGNDDELPMGDGCTVEDLCAEGWHVCNSVHEFSDRAPNCDQAFPGGAVKMFFATRQRGVMAPMVTCDPTSEMGTNNIYGCGNFGSNANAACAPFMHMLRDADCKNTPPWMCVNGPINYSVTELMDVTKPGPDHGGVLCCR
jgi:hypothetical protein